MHDLLSIALKMALLVQRGVSGYGFDGYGRYPG